MAHKVYERKPAGFPVPYPAGTREVTIKDTSTGNCGRGLGRDRDEAFSRALSGLRIQNASSGSSRSGK